MGENQNRKNFTSKKWWKIAIVVFVCLIILLIFLLVVFLAPQPPLKREKDDIELYTERSIQPHRSCCYQHLRINPLDNEKSIKTLKLDTPISNDFYFFHDSESENYHLVSKFESTKYMCTGSCYCEQDASRRTTKVLENGLIYLLAASTTLIATSLARKYFDEQCQATYSESCPEGAVLSEIDKCDEEEMSRMWDDEYNPEKSEDEQCDDCVCEGKEFTIYVCQGRCIPSTKLEGEGEREMVEKYKHLCYGKKREQGINTAIFCENEHKKMAEDGASEEDRMMIHFLMRHLTDEYCEIVTPPKEEGFSLPICMAPQLFPPSPDLPAQIVDAEVKCLNIKEAWTD